VTCYSPECIILDPIELVSESIENAQGEGLLRCNVEVDKITREVIPGPSPPFAPPPPRHPCIGTSLDLDLGHAQVMYSNLGGLGPDRFSPISGTPFPSGIRYVNAGFITLPDGNTMHFDLHLINLTPYSVGDASLNRMNGQLAQIAFAPNTQTDLRVHIRPSCATASSCGHCEAKTGEDKESCYSEGCSCFKELCYEPSCCSGYVRQQKLDAYSCPQMDAPLSFPSGNLVGFSIFDLDTGVAGDYTEQVSRYYMPPSMLTVTRAASCVLISQPMLHRRSSCVDMTISRLLLSLALA
jgi:hypothetical protein